MEETNAMQQGIETERAALLARFIEENAASLMITLRGYVRKAHLVPGDYVAVQEAALELLEEVYIEALRTASRFDPSRPSRAWLLGIANNLVLRKRESKQIQSQREKTVSDLRRADQEELTDEDILDRLTTLYHEGPESGVIANEQYEYLLSLVSEGDRQLLRLAIELDLDGKSLAQVLGCNYNAALVRLCRARQHLRSAFERQRGESNE